MNNMSFMIWFSVYACAMITLGWYVSRKQKTGEDFLLGGRSLPMILTLGSTVGTMVGTGSSVGAVGFGYSNGWAGMLYGLGGAVGILLVAWLFAPVRKLRFMTMSEEMSYYTGGSKIIKNLVAILIFIASIGWLGRIYQAADYTWRGPAALILMSRKLLSRWLLWFMSVLAAIPRWCGSIPFNRSCCSSALF